MDDKAETAVIIHLEQKKLKKSAISRSTIKDQGKKFPTYAIGQQVLVNEHHLSSAIDGEIHKFFLLYRVPYTIIEVLGNNTAIIEDDKRKSITQNTKNINLYVPPDPGKQVELKRTKTNSMCLCCVQVVVGNIQVNSHVYIIYISGQHE